jgi:hypothetical protein
MSKKSPFPEVPRDLLEELNQRWPEQSADLQWTEKEVWHNSGARSVIRFLNAVYKDQQESLL